MTSTDPTNDDSRRAAPDRPRTLRFPWEHTHHEAQDLFWRMGRGQALLTEIHDELAALPDDERRQLLEHAMPPESWLLWAAEWYAYPSTDDDQLADALAVVMAAAGTADAPPGADATRGDEPS